MNKPWLKHYEGIPTTMQYPKTRMVEEIARTAQKYPDNIAYDFLGTKSTYKKFISDINRCANALTKIGMKKGDKVTVCMPNTPHTLIVFYAINAVGAIASMIHPLSSKEEIKFYIDDSQSKYAITLNQFYEKFEDVLGSTSLEKMIIARIPEYLSPVMKVGYKLTKEKNVKKIAPNPAIINWLDLMKMGEHTTFDYVPYEEGATSVILYSGGTTGVSKGILLTDFNFNALAIQVFSFGDCIEVGEKVLTAMPAFHGFGLGICIHMVLLKGLQSILVPQFTPETYTQLIVEKKPNIIAGVPAIFEAMIRILKDKDIDLSYLHGIFVGGDSLTIDLKHRFDAFLKEHNCSATLREGYGTTECVTASCITPKNLYVEGSIGIPIADMVYKIVKPGTQEELPYNEDGEICIAGPTVMKGYANQPEETSRTLQRHSDGIIYLHTGDLGSMDEDGFIFFKQRIKRMIITMGYNVFPSQIENILVKHAGVAKACVIGVPDKIKSKKIKAFIVPTNFDDEQKLREDIFAYLKDNIAAYAMPYEIEFRKELPLTKVGKVAYTVLEQEALGESGDLKQEELPVDLENVEEFVIEIIKKHLPSGNNTAVTLNSRFNEDLECDSLTMLEIVVDVETKLNCSISNKMGQIKTVHQFVKVIKSGNATSKESLINYSDFPMQKTQRDIRKFLSFMKWSKRLWKFNVIGIQNIPKQEQYILCPNHLSHFDGLWVWTAIGSDKFDITKICCLAKKEHLESKLSRFGLIAMGGIPVDRYGNTVPALERAKQCLDAGYNMLIHPEGTRSKDGTLGEFKQGAAKLAVDTGVKIIPVRIDGAFEIFPPHKKLPKIVPRKSLKISFATPIDPNGKTLDELTELIKNEIEKME